MDLQLLLKHGKTTEIINYLKDMPNINEVGLLSSILHLAIIYRNVKVLNYILSRPELDINKVDHKSDTALHLASIIGDVIIVKMLLNRNDIDINMLNKYNESPFYHAIIRGHLDIVKLFVTDERLQFVGHRSDLQRDIFKLVK